MAQGISDYFYGFFKIQEELDAVREQYRDAHAALRGCLGEGYAEAILEVNNLRGRVNSLLTREANAYADFRDILKESSAQGVIDFILALDKERSQNLRLSGTLASALDKILKQVWCPARRREFAALIRDRKEKLSGFSSGQLFLDFRSRNIALPL